MPKYNFSDKQAENLKIFLSRTRLEGVEAEAFVELLAVISNPLPGEPQEKLEDKPTEETKKP